MAVFCVKIHSYQIACVFYTFNIIMPNEDRIKTLKVFCIVSLPAAGLAHVPLCYCEYL